MSYVGNVPTTAAFPFDQFSGNGSTTAFTVSYAPAGTTSIIVSISGVVQNPNTYSVSGTTLTFTPAPPTGTSNIAVLYLGLPVVATLSPGNTAYFSSSVFTATASQTVFTPSGTYQVGFINVIRNGSQLAPADYTATNGTTVTLASPCTAGDTVVIEVFNLTSITGALPLTGGTVTGATTFNAAVTGTSFSTATGTLYPLISSTAVASTSGTSIDFTGIPSTAKRITVMFQSVSTTGTSNYVVRIGNTTFTATGYVSTMTYTNISSNSSVGTTDTTGYLLTRDTSATVSFTGIMTICLLSNFVYVASFNAMSNAGPTYQGSGFLNLGSVLDRVRITTLGGTDTFDAGSINIMWE
jgi:hypothetical protein